MAHRISPHRRRSISVLNQDASTRSSIHQQRRRAYSIAPGEKLSPAAKTRRIIMPRKSILKAPPISSNDNTENSQPGAVPDDVTQSMDFTEVQPSQPRKSFGRRVSFASHAHVRLFEVRDQNANGTADPSSSPDRPPSADNSSNNENTHAQPDEAPRPRRSSISRRRSSVAFSEFGEQSMDMDMDDTAPSLEHFIRDGQYDGTVEEDEEFSDEYDDGEDMDMTEAVPHNLVHRRSLSLPRQPFLPQRRRSSTTPVLTSSQSQRENQPPPPIEQSYTDDTQTSQLDEDMTTSSVQSQSFASEGSSGEHTQPMEFTIPINRSLRPPAEQDNAWQQLRAATHAGVTPTDPQPEVSVEADAELTDALNRMLKARDSIGLPPHNGPLVTRSEGSEGDVSLEDRPLEDSFTSTDDSFSRELDPDGIDEQTMNITTMIRSSLGSTAMDETSVYGGQFPDHEPTELMEPQPQEMEKPPSLRANIFSAPATEQPSRPSVFTLPGQTSKPNVLSAEQQIFSTPEPPPSKASAQPNRSPSKPPASVTVPKPFTFSFRPPVRINAPATPTTPSKVPIFRGTAAFAPPSAPKSPKKRTAPEDTDPHEDGPSAAKKQAIGKLSPAKKSGSEARPGPSTTTTARRTSAVRRPSGYFAQRKSLGGGANTGKPSPRKPTAHGRQSLGSTTPHDDQVSLYPDPSEVAKEVSEPPARIRSPISVMSSPATPANNAHCERETFRQSIVVPSPTRGSPAPAVRVASPVPAIRPTASSLPPPVADSAGITSAEKTAPQSPPPESLSVRTANERRKSHIIPHSQNVFEEQNKHPADDTEPTATQQWRDGVQEEGLEDEGPPISIEQFFEMTGIRFMEEITAPRRSIVHPSQLRPSRRHSFNASQTDEGDDVPLAEFVNALAIDLPQIELYSTVASELSAWIEESRKICKQADEEAIKVTPGLFREFADADESEREFLLHQLKLIKANNHATAKSQWYDWKKEWVGQLQATAETSFAELESDAEVLENVIKQAQAMLPTLRDEYAQVMKELEQEQADIAEIEGSDKEYLNELKVTIAEQDTELEAFRADVSEAKAKLDRLEEKLAEIEAQKEEANNAISQAQHVIHVQKESTSAEVFRLREELAALQDLHLWRCTKLKADLAEFTYASRYQVIIPCQKFHPILSKLDIRRTKASLLRERDPFPQLAQLMIEGGRQLVQTSQIELNMQQIIEQLGDLWSSCAQFRSQLTFLSIKYPLSVETEPVADGSLPNLKATATVLFPTVKAKAFISFILDSQTYSSWPMSIGSLKCEVRVAYGNVKRESILNAIIGRLEQVSPADNHGCLLDACIEATEQYES